MRSLPPEPPREEPPKLDKSIGWCPFVGGTCKTRCTFHKGYSDPNTGDIEVTICMIKDFLKWNVKG